MSCVSGSREVVSIHIGQAGIQMGSAIWELLRVEHEMDSDGNLLCFCPSPLIDSTHSLFYEVRSGRFKARSVYVDSETLVLQELPRGSECTIAGMECASGNFGRGYNLVGTELIKPLMAAFDGMLERTDNLSGIVLYHAMGGGTGSGLTARLVETIKDIYQLRIPMVHFCVYPPPQLSTSIVEPYNTVLATAAMGDAADLMIMVDNQALYTLCEPHLPGGHPSNYGIGTGNGGKQTYVSINRRISQIVSSLTAPYRFCNRLSSDLAILQTNLVPFPDTHYALVAYSAFDDVCNTLSVADISRQCFTAAAQALTLDPMNSGLYMSCCLLYRGLDCGPATINAALQDISRDSDIRFVDWCPSHFKVAINTQMPGYIPCTDVSEARKSLCCLSNSTAIADVWSRLKLRYDAMLHRKAYLHWYKQDGIEEAAFTAAGAKMDQLVRRYKALETTSGASPQTTSPTSSAQLKKGKNQNYTPSDYRSIQTSSDSVTSLWNTIPSCNSSSSSSSLSLADFSKIFKIGNQNSLRLKMLKPKRFNTRQNSQEFLAKFAQMNRFQTAWSNHLQMGGDSRCELCSKSSLQSSRQTNSTEEWSRRSEGRLSAFGSRLHDSSTKPTPLHKQLQPSTTLSSLMQVGHGSLELLSRSQVPADQFGDLQARPILEESRSCTIDELIISDSQFDDDNSSSLETLRPLTISTNSRLYRKSANDFSLISMAIESIVDFCAT